MSLERMGLESLDVLLLHNPEYLIGPGPPSGSEQALYQREEAFYREPSDSRGCCEGRAHRLLRCVVERAHSALVIERRTSLERILEAAELAGGAGIT